MLEVIGLFLAGLPCIALTPLNFRMFNQAREFIEQIGNHSREEVKEFLTVIDREIVITLSVLIGWNVIWYSINAAMFVMMLK